MVKYISNWVDGKKKNPKRNNTLIKINPSNVSQLFKFARSEKVDVDFAVDVAKASQLSWSKIPPVQRGLILHQIVIKMICFLDIKLS